LSSELIAVIGPIEGTRQQAIRRFWAMVEQLDLFDPENRDFIICEGALYQFTKQRKISKNDLTSLIDQHITVSRKGIDNAPKSRKPIIASESASSESKESPKFPSQMGRKRGVSVALPIPKVRSRKNLSIDDVMNSQIFNRDNKNQVSDNDNSEPETPLELGSKESTLEFALPIRIAHFMGRTKASSTAVTKAIWAYMKGRELFDFRNSQVAKPDSKIREILNIQTETITMFELVKVI
jgi:chromatin remodeling complex protein RSC6